jgi:hypothetical protein
MRPAVRRACATLAFAAVAVAGTASPAYARDGTPGWASDSCTLAPDRLFGPACVRHDACYVHHSADRATCDRRFLDDMRAICVRLPAYRAGACTAAAYVYFTAVRLGGWPFYHHPPR